MPATDRLVEILIRTIAETGGLDQTKAKLEQVAQRAQETNLQTAQTAEQAGHNAEQLGTAVGTVAVGSALALGAAIINIVESLQSANAEVAQMTALMPSLVQGCISAANAAKSFADAVRIGASTLPGLSAAATKAAELQRTAAQGPGILASTLELLAKIGGAGKAATPFSDILKLNADTAKAIADYNVAASRGAEELARQHGIDVDNLRTSADLTGAIAKNHDAIVQLETQKAEIARFGTAQDRAREIELEQQIKQRRDLNEELVKIQNEQTQALQKTHDQIAVNLATGNDELTIQTKVKQAYDERFNTLRAAHVPEEQAKTEAQQYADSVEYAARQRLADKAGAEGTAGAQSNLTALTRDYATLLQSLRQQQALIQGNPLLTIDEKNTQLLQLYAQELQLIAQEQQRLNQAFATGQLDASTFAQRMQRLGFETDQLRIKMQALTAGGQFKAELVQWVNSFGTASQQIARGITSTIGTAIGGISQGLTALIFRTGNWKQAFLSAAQSIVQSLIQIGLQMLVTQLLGRTLSQTSAAAQTGPAATAFLAWEPAAIAADTATFGGASAAAIASFGAAIAAGQAFGVATGFELGGYTGPGGERQIAGVVHGGEFVFSAPAVRKIGLDMLAGLHAAAIAPGYQGGGYVSPTNILGASPKVNVIIVDDMRKAKKYLDSAEGQTHLVSLLRRNRHAMGVRH